MHAEIANYLYEIGQLKRVRRSGWWLAGLRDPESVAEHSFRVAVVALILAELEGADVGRTLRMALLHDAGETRVNDLHRLGKAYVAWEGVEERAARDQIRDLPAGLARSLAACRDELEGGASLEARIVGDADKLECLLQAREYAAQGHAVEEWIRSSSVALSTGAGREIAQAILAVDPASWRARPPEVPPGG